MQLSHSVQWTVRFLAGFALFPGWAHPGGLYIIQVSQNLISTIWHPFPAKIIKGLKVGSPFSCYIEKCGSKLVCLGIIPGSVKAVLNREIFVKIQIIK